MNEKKTDTMTTAMILEAGLRVAREKIDPELPTQHLHLFLHAVLNTGSTIKELETLTGISRAAASRIVDYLSFRQYRDKPGPGLLAAEEDPFERRRKIVRVTPKGERFLQDVAAEVSKAQRKANRRSA